MQHIFLFIICLMFSVSHLQSQNQIQNHSQSLTQYRITLQECQAQAQQNYPLIKQNEFLALAKKYTLRNISKVYIPRFSINGQASYQTESTQLEMKKDPGFEVSEYVDFPEKAQYNVIAEITQLIWDGGNSRALSHIAKSQNAVEKEETEVSLYLIRDKINQIYFGILSLDEQFKQLDILETDLKSNYKIITSKVKNGVALQSDLDMIKVELLNVSQKRTEIKSYRKAYLNMLSIFIGKRIDDQVILEIPSSDIKLPLEITRPELQLFEKQKDLFQAKRKEVNSKNMPFMGLFAQGGYGKPGINKLDPDSKFYGVGGIRLTWDFANLYTSKNEKRIIEINKSIIDIKQKTFLFNVNLEISKIRQEILKYKSLIETDEEIVKLRTNIKQSGEGKYKNGVYLINNLISDINAENMARQEKAQHYIQYLFNIYTYKYVQGDLK